MTIVPFSLGEVYAGFGECTGILKDGGDHLHLEFQIKDAVAGVLKSDVRQVTVPRDELVSVTVTKGWLGTSWLGIKIVIQTATLETLKDVPGMNQGQIELRIARKDVKDAEQFFAEFFKDAERIASNGSAPRAR